MDIFLVHIMMVSFTSSKTQSRFNQIIIIIIINPHCNWVWTKDNILVFSTQYIFKILSKDNYILYWKDAVTEYYFQCIAQYHVPHHSKIEDDNVFCCRSSNHICAAHWSEMTNPLAKVTCSFALLWIFFV